MVSRVQVMFAKRAQNPPRSGGAFGPGGRAAPAGAAVAQAVLAHPLVGAAGAGLLFAAAVAGLIAVAGDPGAGAPFVRVALTRPFSTSFAALSQSLAAGASATTLSPGSGQAPAQALPQAPIAGLSAPGPGGLLPVIGPDGRTPAQAYARPFTDTGAPKVALVIGGLGLNATATREAIEQLPPAVTLSFVPYTDGLQGWIDLARANGHEVLLETPMEPMDYPQNDPGPFTLMAQDSGPETVKRLEWLLSRATGYFGVTNYLGGRFLASDPAMGVFAGALRQRGLAFIDDGSASGRASGIPRASADLIIDQTLDGGSIDQQLTSLESAAQQHGRALGSGFAYPVTLDEVKRWAAGLNSRGLLLAPASAVMGRG
jgi:polysaccharide deacetylase 2 family uncharacterized protein YibQ